MEINIQRINELARKAKAEGLTPAEKEEQQKLRREYIAAVKMNLRTQLDNIDVQEKDGLARAGIFNGEVGVVLRYDKRALPCFTQWKMMGEHDYVLGLEPGNCTPDGRDVLRREGRLAFLEPDAEAATAVEFCFVDDRARFEEEF